MAGELSLLLKEDLVQTITTALGEISAMRHRIHGGEAELLHQVARMLDKQYPARLAALMATRPAPQAELLAAAQRDAHFGTRIKQLVLEAVYGEPLAPPLRIVAMTEEAPLLLPAASVYAFVVDQLPNVVNELYPLMIDAYVFSLERRVDVQAIGVHTSWLDSRGWATRAIVFDAETEALYELDLPQPRRLDQAHFLCIAAQPHQIGSQTLQGQGIFVVNPYDKIQAADDKYLCYQMWSQSDVKTPDAVKLGEEETLDEHSFHEFMASLFPRFFPGKAEVILLVQPNQGTEGRGTRAFTGPGDWPAFLEKNPGLFATVQEVAKYDDVLLRQGVGNAMLCTDDIGTSYFDLRFNIIRGRAESGYLMQAPTGAIVSSPGAGGWIVEWKSGDPLPVVVQGQSHPLEIGGQAWQQIVTMAERAFACFPSLRMAGVDVRLEYTQGQWIPWILDINPRPAGLAHSRYMHNREPGVTQRLWTLDARIDSRIALQ
ncbi:MAG: hypothetical protein RBU29_04840 [bacterium]|jgi:hypothetical protein|nr:hypothetical protein [bacterium]